MRPVRSRWRIFYCELTALIRETRFYLARGRTVSRSRGLDLSTFDFPFARDTTNVCVSCRNSRSVATRSQAPRTGVAILIDPLRPFGAILSSRSVFLLARHVERRSSNLDATCTSDINNTREKESDLFYAILQFFHSP